MTHADAVTSLATGFEGRLFGWWTRTLRLNARTTIINHTKTISTTTLVRTSIDPSSFIPSTSTTTTTSQPDGNPNRLQGKEISKLQNLKCKKLSDFKWYKDIFLTRVLQRADNANSYWKENFLSGLSKLFSNKVRDKMVEQMGMSDWSQIDLNTWTYGEIIATINTVALQLCNDIRLKSQLKKKQQLTTKKELGSWCEQFGFDKHPICRKRKTSKDIYRYRKKTGMGRRKIIPK
ncbi:hypothetical protein Ddye_000315 [Dipteronia dyeriana]|uniref:Uncharacterized protein n=1 Tax=Dipteronia dyeriana TaxID=168575 RepID=A0AAD9XLE8_9ROSI|nr:hypothetical protein Ddye_000315 [Dipteronia dyeriana]